MLEDAPYKAWQLLHRNWHVWRRNETVGATIEIGVKSEEAALRNHTPCVL